MVGYSSARNVFYYNKADERPNMAEWDNGDIITVTLDCDARTLVIARNGDPLPALPVQPQGRLYPWINLYQSDSSVTLLPEDGKYVEEQPIVRPLHCTAELLRLQT